MLLNRFPCSMYCKSWLFVDHRAYAAAPGTVEDEVGWLRRVVEHRRGRRDDAPREAVGRNLAASVAAGTTSLADTTPAGLSWGQVAKAPVRGVVFAEIIGLRRSRGLQTSKAAWDWIGSLRPESLVIANTRPGLPGANSPYAILRHCLGVMEFWGGQVVAGRTVDRDRDAEFRASGPVADLIARAQQAQRRFRADIVTADPRARPLGGHPTTGPYELELTSQGHALLHEIGRAHV